MLAAMTSLALLAHATRAAAPPFNANFYIVVATIIPVLFVALAVEGHAYQDLLKGYGVVGRFTAPKRPWYQIAAATIARYALFQIAYSIVVFGAITEILSGYVLYQQRVGSSTGQVVLVGTIFMVLAVVAGPAIALGRALLIRALQEAGFARNRPANTAPVATGPAPHPSEPGKTDPVLDQKQRAKGEGITAPPDPPDRLRDRTATAAACQPAPLPALPGRAPRCPRCPVPGVPGVVTVGGFWLAALEGRHSVAERPCEANYKPFTCEDVVSEGGLEHENRGDLPGPGKSCNQGNKNWSAYPVCSAKIFAVYLANWLCHTGVADPGAPAPMLTCRRIPGCRSAPPPG